MTAPAPGPDFLFVKDKALGRLTGVYAWRDGEYQRLCAETGQRLDTPCRLHRGDGLDSKGAAYWMFSIGAFQPLASDIDLQWERAAYSRDRHKQPCQVLPWLHRCPPATDAPIELIVRAASSQQRGLALAVRPAPAPSGPRPGPTPPAPPAAAAAAGAPGGGSVDWDSSLPPAVAAPPMPSQEKLAEVKRFEDRFERGHLLARGGFGDVFSAKEKQSGREVVVKVTNLKKLPTQQLREAMLQRELVNPLQFRHANITTMLDGVVSACGEDISSAYEYMAGGNLLERCIALQKAGGHLSSRQTMRFFGDIVSGTLYLHSHGFAHRDLKPQNVLLNEADVCIATAKLADFGFTREYDGSTLMETCVGTTHFVAPEVYASPDGYDLRVDFWSLGSILFLLATNVPPFVQLPQPNGSVRNEQICKMQECYNPAARITRVPVRVSDLFFKLLKPKPGDRPTGDELRADPYIVECDAEREQRDRGVRAEHEPRLLIPTSAPGQCTSVRPPAPDQQKVSGDAQSTAIDTGRAGGSAVICGRHGVANSASLLAAERAMIMQGCTTIGPFRPWPSMPSRTVTAVALGVNLSSDSAASGAFYAVVSESRGRNTVILWDAKHAEEKGTDTVPWAEDAADSEGEVLTLAASGGLLAACTAGAVYVWGMLAYEGRSGVQLVRLHRFASGPNPNGLVALHQGSASSPTGTAARPALLCFPLQSDDRGHGRFHVVLIAAPECPPPPGQPQGRVPYADGWDRVPGPIVCDQQPLTLPVPGPITALAVNVDGCSIAVAHQAKQKGESLWVYEYQTESIRKLGQRWEESGLPVTGGDCQPASLSFSDGATALIAMQAQGQAEIWTRGGGNRWLSPYHKGRKQQLLVAPCRVSHGLPDSHPVPAFAAAPEGDAGGHPFCIVGPESGQIRRYVLRVKDDPKGKGKVASVEGSSEQDDAREEGLPWGGSCTAEKALQARGKALMSTHLKGKKEDDGAAMVSWATCSRPPRKCGLDLRGGSLAILGRGMHYEWPHHWIIKIEGPPAPTSRRVTVCYRAPHGEFTVFIDFPTATLQTQDPCKCFYDNLTYAHAAASEAAASSPAADAVLPLLPPPPHQPAAAASGWGILPAWLWGK